MSRALAAPAPVNRLAGDGGQAPGFSHSLQVWCGSTRATSQARKRSDGGAGDDRVFPEGAFGPALNSMGIAQACRDLGHRAVFIGDPTLADAILDCIVHNSHRLELDGPSMRKIKADKTALLPLTKHKENDINRSPNGEDHAHQIGPLNKWPFWIGINGRFPVGIGGRFHRNTQIDRHSPDFQVGI